MDYVEEFDKLKTKVLKYILFKKRTEQEVRQKFREDSGELLDDVIEWAYCIIIAIVLAILFRYYIGTPTVVKQPSMYNTLEEGQRLILSRWTRTVKGTYYRGDIVTFEAPSQTQISTFDVDMNNPVAIYDYTRI